MGFLKTKEHQRLTNTCQTGPNQFTYCSNFNIVRKYSIKSTGEWAGCSHFSLSTKSSKVFKLCNYCLLSKPCFSTSNLGCLQRVAAPRSNCRIKGWPDVSWAHRHVGGEEKPPRRFPSTVFYYLMKWKMPHRFRKGRPIMKPIKFLSLRRRWMCECLQLEMPNIFLVQKLFGCRWRRK